MTVLRLQTKRLRRTECAEAPLLDSAYPIAFGNQTVSSVTLTRHSETHGFASLLHNRFAFIVAIEVKRAIYLVEYCGSKTVLSRFNYCKINE